ncbi:enoyl-CoA hydratase/isomerase family protein [[Mycobacterium] burgundiense]|uniref:Enoyl-CoA hydratase/isomerase family protein n=1 Tax=[Mycobacterium] burgundiense TaxID=3064286 RepID=A0ABM9LHC5_9MYCO|nr:enoyl-CoA hydratase/isomerase family protein [Mycolicibacterium sp. MU0053]CAJ1499048.1 enoyl-CoA hydratase/isomerase family protein [Mycolicibacterium sp. MU0053]
MSVSYQADSGIGQITLNRPERMNAISIELATGLERAILDLGRDPAVNVIVIRGAGGNFSAGGDFGEVERLRAEGAPALKGLFSAFRAACDAISAVEIPVVAAVQGVAAAGGFELMQAADIVLVSADAKIADSHVKFAMVPGGGSSARLPRLVGRQQALGLLLSGDRLSGAEAVALGLAYRAYPDQEFNAAVTLFAQQLAGRSRQSVITIKRLVRSGLDQTLPEALDTEIDAVVQHILGDAGTGSVEQFENRNDRRTRA